MSGSKQLLLSAMEAFSNSLLEKQQSIARLMLQPVIPVFWSLEQEDCHIYKTIQGYIVSSRPAWLCKLPTRSYQALRTHIKKMVMAEYTLQPSSG